MRVVARRHAAVGADLARPAARRRRARARRRSCPRRTRRARRPRRPRRRAARTRCGKASRKKPEMRTVTSMRGRPSSASGHDLDARHAPGLRMPRRPHAEQREDLGDVVALRAHRGGAPGDEADHPRQRAGLGQVAVEQRVGEPPADLPRQLRGQGARVDASRSCARSAARRCARGSARPTGPRATWRPRSARRTLVSSSGVRRIRGTTSSQAKRSARSTPASASPRTSVHTSAAALARPVARGERVEQRHAARPRGGRRGRPRWRSARGSAPRRPAGARSHRRAAAPPPAPARRARTPRRRRGAGPARRREPSRSMAADEPAQLLALAARAPSTCRPSLIWMSLTSHR